MTLPFRVTIQSDATVASASGGKKPWTTPATVADVWANIESGSGVERFENWTTNVGQYKISIRYRTDVTNAHRILFGTRTFQIRHVPIVPRRPYMTLLCEEVT